MFYAANEIIIKISLKIKTEKTLLYLKLNFCINNYERK